MYLGPPSTIWWNPIISHFFQRDQESNSTPNYGLSSQKVSIFDRANVTEKTNHHGFQSKLECYIKLSQKLPSLYSRDTRGSTSATSDWTASCQKGTKSTNYVVHTELGPKGFYNREGCNFQLYSLVGEVPFFFFAVMFVVWSNLE